MIPNLGHRAAVCCRTDHSWWQSRNQVSLKDCSSFPMPLVRDMANEVDEPCPTSQTLCSYASFVGYFAFIFLVSVASGDVLDVRGGMGVEDMDSKECTFEQPFQKPSAMTSSLAPYSLIAEAHERASPVISCSGGSMPTSWHTSDIKFVKSLTSFCCNVGNPPWGRIGRVEC